VRGGGWLVEETGRSIADSLRSCGGTSFTRLALPPSLEAVEAKRRSEPFLGAEECRIRQDEKGGYVAQVTDLDGFQGELRLDNLTADGALLRVDEQTWRGRREIPPSGEGE